MKASVCEEMGASCLFYIETLLRLPPTNKKTMSLQVDSDANTFVCGMLFADVYMLNFSLSCMVLVLWCVSSIEELSVVANES